MKIIISSLKNNLCILGLLISFQILILNCTSTAQSRIYSEGSNKPSATSSGKELTSDKICEIAKSRTVLILSQEKRSQGTGFLIHKKPLDNGRGFRYKVVTSAHVLTEAKNYGIQTVDEIVHSAIELFRFGNISYGKDLTILQFDSKENYDIAELAHGRDLPEKSSSVIAAGYPLRTGGATRSDWVCTNHSTVRFVLKQPMKGGYRIGYIFSIRKGMSGGPLFNLQGQVVGVNGRHSDPPFGERRIYVYEDGTPINRALDVLKDASWAIPMEVLVKEAMSKGICLYYDDIEDKPTCKKGEEISGNQKKNSTPSQNSTPNVRQSPTPSPLISSSTTPRLPRGNAGDNNDSKTLTDEELRQRAQKITIKVKISSSGNQDVFFRSGFVLKKESRGHGYQYTGIVYVREKIDLQQITIVAPNGEEIRVIGKETKFVDGGSELLEIKFNDSNAKNNNNGVNKGSNVDYEKAVLTSSSLKPRDEVFASGYVGQPTNDFMFIKCNVDNVDNVDDMDNSRIYLSNSKKITEKIRGRPLKITEEMLGGPLMNSKGEVIGINTNHDRSTWSPELNTSSNSISALASAIPIGKIIDSQEKKVQPQYSDSPPTPNQKDSQRREPLF